MVKVGQTADDGAMSRARERQLGVFQNSSLVKSPFKITERIFKVKLALKSSVALFSLSKAKVKAGGERYKNSLAPILSS